MTPANRDNCHKRSVQHKLFGLRQARQHKTLDIAFNEHHETGEVAFGKGQQRAKDELGERAGCIRRKFNSANTENAILGIAAAISNLGWLDTA